MKTISVNVYRFNELNQKAQEKVMDMLNETNDIELVMNDVWKSLLEENKIKFYDGKLCYSLSNCQGDGVSFTGRFEWNDKQYKVTRFSNYYCHVNTVSHEVYNEQDDEWLTADIAWKEMYKNICLQLEQFGYKQIEKSYNKKYVSEICNDNEWYFFADGKLA